MTVIDNPNNNNSPHDNIRAAMEAKKAKRGGAGRVGAKKLDMHRFMTDDAYLIEHIGGQAVRGITMGKSGFPTTSAAIAPSV